MELLTYFKKLEYQISHLFLFLRSLLSFISQYSHISVWSIRWSICTSSFPIKNVSSVAAHISFGSWVAGGLICCKCAAVAECMSHQIHGPCGCCVLRRSPSCPPGHRVSPTSHWGLCLYSLPHGHHWGTGWKPKATSWLPTAVMYRFIQKGWRKCEK